ncbi:MAG: hypothetical protein H6658_19395 [Ardenticatenaceae bacterium]|nr:hypothetical protein [Ardenticatenaceae bacterium]
MTVLTPLQRLPYADYAGLLAQIRPGGWGDGAVASGGGAAAAAGVGAVEDS